MGQVLFSLIISSSPSLNINLTTKLTNDYASNSDIKKGIIFGKNADGSFFSFRPILSQNLLQITKNDAIGLFNVSSNGIVSTTLSSDTTIINPITNQNVKPVYSRLSADGGHNIEILWFSEDSRLSFYVDGNVICSFKQGTVI